MNLKKKLRDHMSFPYVLYQLYDKKEAFNEKKLQFLLKLLLFSILKPRIKDNSNSVIEKCFHCNSYQKKIRKNNSTFIM